MSPLCAAKPECRNFVCAHLSSTRADRPRSAGRAFGPRQTLRIEAENPPDARGDPKRREQSRRMKATAMELTRRQHCGGTRSHWPRRSRWKLAAGHRAPAFASPFRRAQVRKRQRRRDSRTAHVHDRLVMRVVVPSA